MTREEAIDVVESFRNVVSRMENTEYTVEALDMAVTALRPVSRERVEKVWRGEWIKHNGYTECSKCEYWYPSTEDEEEDDRNSFCPACGRAMTDEAVDMVMERLEAIR